MSLEIDITNDIFRLQTSDLTFGALNTDNYFAVIPTELMKEAISKFGVNLIDPCHLLNNVPRKEKLMK